LQPGAPLTGRSAHPDREDPGMSKSVGRSLLIGFIWVLALFYYLEVRGFTEPSETMTITAVFWFFTLLAAVELFRLLRSFHEGPRRGEWGVIFHSVLRDKRSHLAVLICIYLVLIPILGFYTASFLSFAAFSYALGARELLRIFLPNVLILVFIYIVFSVLLKITLPAGLLF
jgi:hypothetical protein